MHPVRHPLRTLRRHLRKPCRRSSINVMTFNPMANRKRRPAARPCPDLFCGHRWGERGDGGPMLDLRGHGGLRLGCGTQVTAPEFTASSSFVLASGGVEDRCNDPLQFRAAHRPLSVFINIK